MSGIQALVRLPLDQMRKDRAAGLNTATFISGYRGSPLGGYDLQLEKNSKLLEEHDVKFQPGVNEELAATAVWGSQQVNLFEGAKYDGVCGIWYGKTPGVDRSTDAFRHGNAAGTSEFGGVLVVAGDDHGCKSSSYPGQSEFAFVDMHMPVLNPADVSEVLDFGLFGIELSRYSGCWVALITLTENMDSVSSIELKPARTALKRPSNIECPPGGLNIRLDDSPLEQEERLWRYKRPAAIAFARENNINRVAIACEEAKLGIVAAGKAYLDVMRAFELMGIDEARAQQLGVRVLKVGMTYPLDVEGVVGFARDLEYLFVVEEKRSLMEVQLKEELYNVEVVDPSFPKIIGKLDSQNNPLLPAYGELSPLHIAEVLIEALPEWRDTEPKLLVTLEQLIADLHHPKSSSGVVKRSPFFCSGCPHNTSTKVPEGSRALAGIGCHYLVQGMDRSTQTFTQMGGEGVSWIGQHAFTSTEHVFVNLGDGTYFHSGILAIRAAVAAGVNITYKILYNDAVAMTGGQQIGGSFGAEQILAQLLAEGVARVVWVVESDAKAKQVSGVPSGVELRHRRDLDEIQRELRVTKGVTCIVYDQPCATELRRKRKRGLVEPPRQRTLINEAVCEGCGDCSVQSNCISIEPMETLFGTKRRINQTSCNLDYSCINGFCPSFVLVEGGKLRKPQAEPQKFIDAALDLPEPEKPDLDRAWNILITGVGGSGVITVGALLSTAAFLEGKEVTTLDQTGLAQKGGAVYTHVRIARSRQQLSAVRLANGSADALIACDAVAAASRDACLVKLDPQKSRGVANVADLPTADFVLGKPGKSGIADLLDSIQESCPGLVKLDAFDLSERALGSTTCSNIVMLGAAAEQGLLPVTLEAIYRAIEINGVLIAENKAAFSVGRLAVTDPEKLRALIAPLHAEVNHDSLNLSDLVFRMSEHLTEYQDAKYAQRYLEIVRQVQVAEQSLASDSEKLTRAVARYLSKVMSYKDEYEVARLHADPKFAERIENSFEGDYVVKYSLAPPLVNRLLHGGKPRKIALGSWMKSVFPVLAWFKFLRGTKLDVFGWSEERRLERELIDRYEKTVELLVSNLCSQNLDLAVQIASLPEEIRGFGHVKERAFLEVSGKWESMLDHYLAGAENWETSQPDDQAVGADVVKIIEPA